MDGNRRHFQHIMKRIVFGAFITVCTFLAGIGANELIGRVYLQIWPAIPNLNQPEDTAIHEVELCQLQQLHGVFAGKLIRVKVRRETGGGTILGFLQTNACEGLIRSKCPDEVTCSLIPELIGSLERAKSDVEITGKFLEDHIFGDHSIEIHKVVAIPSLINCPYGSRVEESVECPLPQYREIDLRIDGVGQGTTLKGVIGVLGQPLKSIKLPRNDCADARELKLEYEGLTLYLLDDESGNGYRVYSFEVISPNWNVSGIRIGDRFERFEQTFGRSVSGSYTTITYEGWIGLETQDGKLVSIFVETTLC